MRDKTVENRDYRTGLVWGVTPPYIVICRVTCGIPVGVSVAASVGYLWRYL